MLHRKKIDNNFFHECVAHIAFKFYDFEMLYIHI